MMLVRRSYYTKYFPCCVFCLSGIYGVQLYTRYTHHMITSTHCHQPIQTWQIWFCALAFASCYCYYYFIHSTLSAATRLCAIVPFRRRQPAIVSFLHSHAFINYSVASLPFGRLLSRLLWNSHIIIQ